jgi:hypothetical protein
LIAGVASGIAGAVGAADWVMVTPVDISELVTEAGPACACITVPPSTPNATTALPPMTAASLASLRFMLNLSNP